MCDNFPSNFRSKTQNSADIFYLSRHMKSYILHYSRDSRSDNCQMCGFHVLSTQHVIIIKHSVRHSISRMFMMKLCVNHLPLKLILNFDDENEKFFLGKLFLIASVAVVGDFFKLRQETRLKFHHNFLDSKLQF